MPKVQSESHLLLPSRISRVRLCATPWTAAHQALRPWDSPGRNTAAGPHQLCVTKAELRSGKLRGLWPLGPLVAGARVDPRPIPSPRASASPLCQQHPGPRDSGSKADVIIEDKPAY